jgi:hypothetical protein
MQRSESLFLMMYYVGVIYLMNLGKIMSVEGDSVCGFCQLKVMRYVKV